jgi:hypothetical protein
VINLYPIGRFDVTQAVLQIKQRPDLWDQYTERTENPTSPHREVSDIWVRGRDRADLTGGWGDYVEEIYDPVWFPAASELPAVKDLCFDLMTAVRGEKLGSVLITRVPPGGQVYPHTDRGYNALNFEKYCIQLEAQPEQGFFFAEGGYSAQPGEVYWFRNTVEHWVKNDSPVDRISLIVSIMKDRRMVCLGEP